MTVRVGYFAKTFDAFKSERDNAAELGARTIFGENGSFKNLMKGLMIWKTNLFRTDDVVQELSISKPYAYKLIQKLNEELKAQGFITIAGRVNRQFFMKGSTESGKEMK